MQISIKQAELYRKGCLALAERCKFMLDNPKHPMFKNSTDNPEMERFVIHQTMEDAYHEAGELGNAIELAQTNQD